MQIAEIPVWAYRTSHRRRVGAAGRSIGEAPCTLLLQRRRTEAPGSTIRKLSTAHTVAPYASFVPHTA
eukprot:3730419-Rhodomonas_salina.1